MNIFLSYQFNALVRIVVACALVVFLVLLSVTPIYLPGYPQVAPNFLLMAVFFWAVHRSELLPAVMVFFVGLLQDILVGMPLGFSAIILILIRALAVSQKRVFLGKSFLMLWWGFGLVAFLAAFGLWTLTIIYNQIFLDPRPILFQASLTIVIFPVVSWFFAWLNLKIFPKN